MGHRVARNAAAMGAIQLVNYGAAFVVLILLTRTLSLDTYGVVAFSVGIVQVLSIVLDLGFTLSATQQIAEQRDDREFVARLSGAVLVVKLTAVMVGAALLALYAHTTQKYANYSLLIMLTSLPLLGHALQPLWFFSGIERMRYLTAFVVVAKLTFLLLVWMLVRSDADYWWVPLADGVAQISAAVFGLALIYWVGYRIARPQPDDVRQALRSTAGFFVSRLAATAYGYCGVLILGMTAAPAAIAVYSFAEQLYRAMHSLFAPVVQALYPYMSKERDLRLLGKVAAGATGVAGAGALVGHFVAPWLVPAVFGAQWQAALPVLDVFLLTITLHVMAMMASYPLAAALGRTEVANQAVVWGAMVYVALASVLFLTGAASPIRLAWLMAASETYVLSHCLLAFRATMKRSSAQNFKEPPVS